MGECSRGERMSENKWVRGTERGKGRKDMEGCGNNQGEMRRRGISR